MCVCVRAGSRPSTFSEEKLAEQEERRLREKRDPARNFDEYVEKGIIGRANK